MLEKNFDQEAECVGGLPLESEGSAGKGPETLYGVVSDAFQVHLFEKEKADFSSI